MLAGALADRFGFGVAFGVSGAITLLAGLAWLGARETLGGAGPLPRPRTGG